MEHVILLRTVAILSTLCALCSCSDPITFRIPEEQPIGYSVGNVLEMSSIARDELRFTLMQQGKVHENYFQINEISGDLTTKEVIDSDILCQFDACEFWLEIAAQTAKNDGFFEVVRVLVIIDDINDHGPTFTKQSVNLPISEAVVTGANFTIDGARDMDTSENYSIANYELVPKLAGDDLPFGIKFSKSLDGSSTVMLSVVHKLDRETRDHYQFYLVAKDGGNPPLNGTLLVNVTILDTNDVYPTFDSTPYNVTVKEDVSVNTVILTVTAGDLDEGKNAEVRYRLSPHQQGENLNTFAIDAVTGELQVTAALTQNIDSYKLIVEASDQGNVPLTTQTFVTVTVLDTENNAPEIHINLLSQQNFSRISEYANIGAVVAHVAIVDHDTGRNGDVTCFVLSDLFGLQRYDVNEYKVTVIKTLDRERDSTHNVEIRCDDKGVPPTGSSSSFVVHIDDENDNAPTFRQQKYFANIDENNEIGDRITTVSAFDLDVGNNSNIIYVIPPDSTVYAFVNPSTGDVMASKPLDKEGKVGSGFSVTVLAIDQGSPALTGTTTVLVTINDVNDQAPVFDQANFRFWINENLPADTDIGWVTAKDGDEFVNNAKTRFEIKPYPSDTIVPFVVFSDGNIKTNRELDRENTSEYTFEITATDVADENLFSTASVTVFIVDVNDNDPKILMPKPGNDTVRVPYLTSPGNVIYYVVATDLDKPETDNSKLTYSLSTLNKTNVFTIDPKSGGITLEAPLSNTDLIGKVYILTITVRDNGHGTKPATSNLRVHITADNGTTNEQEEASTNFVIAVSVATVTVVISAGIIVTICIIRLLDKKRKTRNSNIKVLSENMYSKGYTKNNDEVDNIFPLPMDASYIERKKKEVSFSLDDNGTVDNTQSMMGVEGQGHDSLEHILLEPPPQYQQLDIPKGKLDDSHSDMSGESAGDSGKGGSDDDLHVSGLGYGRDDVIRPKDRWDQRRSKSPGVHQMQTFPTTRYQPTNSLPHQKIIPFSFKKTPTYTSSGQTVNMNNLSPINSAYSVPMYYDDESHSSSGFQSVDSNSNLNNNSHRSAGKLNLNGFRGNMSKDCVV